MKIEKQNLLAPLMAHLEITDSCNHKCLHCYKLDSKIENRPKRKVDDETVLACAQKLIDNGIIQIVITGGEPLLNKELVKKIITLSNRNKVIVSVNTNLTLLDDDFLNFLIKTETRILTSCPSGISSSFEKLTLTDNYAIFEKNVKKIVAANLKIAINMVVTKDNLHEIRTTAQKMKELGCRSFYTTPMSLNMDYPRIDLLLSTDEVRQMFDELLWVEKTFDMKVDSLDVVPKCIFSDKTLSEDHLFLKRKCLAGHSFIAVSCNGDVRPCANNTISYGNILEEELKMIWEKMSDWRSMKYVPKKCKNCTWVNRCLGGCRINAKVLHGKWDAEDVWCDKPLKSHPPLLKKPIDLNDDLKFQINDEYLYRQESENVFIVYNVRNNMFFMINKEYFKFMEQLKKYGTINFSDLKKHYNITDENKSFIFAIKFLVQCKILKPVN